MINYVMDISPEVAESMLSENSRNRKIDKYRVALYATQMQEGKWRLNGEPIILSESGSLLNGQHRLSAVIASGVTIKSLVVNGIPDSDFDTIDQGKPRTNGDIFSIAGMTNAHDKSSIVGQYMFIERLAGLGYYKPKKIPAHDLLDFYYKNKELVEEAVNISEAISKKIKFSQTRIGGMYIYLSSYGDVKEFFGIMHKPDNVPYKHPANILRDSLRNVKSHHTDYSKFYTYFISAWNHYVDGNEISMLRYSSESALPTPKTKNNG